MPQHCRKWILAAPMVGYTLTRELFALREIPIPDIQINQALVRVKLINIHSATRTRIATGLTKLGDTDYTNYACAEVLKSRDPIFNEGDIIACQTGWQDYQIISSKSPSVGYGTPSELVKVLNGTNSQWTYLFRPALVKMWPPEVLMDIFGTSGMTAYFGMRECGPLIPRDCVAVAGATGSVGSIVVQLAKHAGCYVVGFAGGTERCGWVVDHLGADRSIDYKADDFDIQLRDAFTDGIDVFSDGIGGPLTETVARLMNEHSRLFSFGRAAAFYTGVPEKTVAIAHTKLRQNFGISDSVQQIIDARHIRSEAWIVDEFYDERLKAEGDLSRLLRRGVLKPVNTIIEGFENLPEAIENLYAAPRNGKLQVRFEPAPFTCASP